jgi:hypothetical protein
MVKASELVREQKKREEEKKKVYDKIYQKIEKKIQMASNMNFFQITYEIPEYALGIPIYDLAECIKYVDKKLIKNEFKTSWDRNIVYVNWQED